jgi:hypothetical protein
MNESRKNGKCTTPSSSSADEQFSPHFASGMTALQGRAFCHRIFRNLFPLLQSQF